MNDHNKTESGKAEFVNSIMGGMEFIPDTEIQQIEKSKQDEKRKRLDSSFQKKAPSRYRNVDFQSDPKLLDTDRLVIYGPYGTGKTYMGYSIARELYVSERVKDFKIVREREIYNTILENQNNMGKVREMFFNVGLLVIDEYGKNSNSEAAASQIFNIIDYRYDWELRTILICNATTGAELKSIVPEAIQDRFAGRTFKLEGKSRRSAEW